MQGKTESDGRSPGEDVYLLNPAACSLQVNVAGE